MPLFALLVACAAPSGEAETPLGRPSAEGHAPAATAPRPADADPDRWLDRLRGRRVGLVVNHTARVGTTHLADTLLALGIDVDRVFAPEHGFRGTEDAGAHVESGRDPTTGLPVISLYGAHKKPTAGDLEGLDLLVFDIQDVGARFYTYLSTLHYVMEAGAEHGVPVLVLDRPNPNGHVTDGPVLDTARFRSFVGLHPIPVLHGMTLGELARMINGEGWLAGGRRCDLTVIPCTGYRRADPWDPPVAPSPNLRSAEAILLYPSLCFFEGTTVSVGRGTPTPFRVLGHPDFGIGSYAFTPEPGPGAAHPKHEGRTCYGTNLTGLDAKTLRQNARLDLSWLLGYHEYLAPRVPFFLDNGFFDKLAGTGALRRQISEGWDEDRIRASWQTDLERFRAKRQPYLLYP
jgi:uncharacterized protein YbbC (DUF1343 family)